MKNLLVGNGINIQFDSKNYSAQQIVLRILKNCDRDDFPSHIIVNYPYLMKNYLGQLFLEAREMISGKYDKYAIGSAEVNALESFKKRYRDDLSTSRITDIGFEDYYLIHDLACHKTKTQNPEQYYVRESMRISYLFAIYNYGQLNQLFNYYSPKFINFLCSFDKIFTTNYDSNIESVTHNKVYHIHGQFNERSDVYNPDSFRNQLPDRPIKDYEIDEAYFYLYSNALSTHCGAYKEFQINQHSQANSCVEKMASAYLTDGEMRKTIDSWTTDTNTLTANLGYSIQLKAAHPELRFSDHYHFDIFKQMQGELIILGLSPWNDFHIFEAIDHSLINKCTFYYFNDNECQIIKDLLPILYKQNKLNFTSVIDFWEDNK